MLDIILWVIAAALMVIGFAGTIVPMIPGLPLIFAGAWLAAFIDHYNEISVMTLVILAVLTVIGLIVDWIAQTLGAQKAGATKLGILGSFIGTIIGIFTGLWGLIFMPLLGAAIGEFIDHRDLLKSGNLCNILISKSLHLILETVQCVVKFFVCIVGVIKV